MNPPGQAESKEDLWEIRTALDYMAADNRLSPPVYYKGLVLLAAKCADAGLFVEAVDNLCVVPSTYYVEDQLLQMAEDPEYSRVAGTLADKLVATGLVSMDPPPFFGFPQHVRKLETC